MPEIRHYKVTQIREVEVSANSATDAAIIAEAAFDEGQRVRNDLARVTELNKIWGHTTSKVREISLRADEEGKVNG